MIDFKNKLKEMKVAKPTSPIDIYDSLDRSSTAAGPLRPIQESVLKDWYDNHLDDKDVVVKLHTGQGKTLTGLLMLQSKLNMGKGPCLYVCPNKQLAEQVKKDAEKFGIQYCELGAGDKYFPHEFEEGKKIMITYVQKVFNGKTIFGLDNKAVHVGTFLLDDSHACIDFIRKSFSIEILRNTYLYKELLELFKDSLTEQAPGDFYKVRSTEFETTVLAVPYWDWIRKNNDVLRKLIEADAEETIFALPLLQNILTHCTMYVTGNRIEITPDYMLIDRFSSFNNAECRILMSATTQDDSFFIKGFGFAQESIEHPLTYVTDSWSGEKMILFPTLLNDAITGYHVREMFKKTGPTRRFGIVSLVPSYKYADENYRACNTPRSSEIDNTISYLSSGNCPDIVVFVNRYDGIDLADNKCRILIIDGLPVFNSLVDRYECSCRQGSNLIDIKVAQKIEQGLGRSVRSETDYSVIIILGEDLIRFVRSSFNQKYFSAQTRCQIEIGDEVTQMTKEELDMERPFKPFVETLRQCLNRDEGWKAYYREQMNEKIQSDIADVKPNVIDFVLLEYEVEKALKVKDYVRATRQLNKLVEKCTTDADKGWYQQILAKYTFINSEVDAAKHQYDAHYNNKYLFIPENFPYKKLGTINSTRIQMIREYIQRFDNYNDFKLFIDELCANFSFGVTAEKFEIAVKHLGEYLGFESQRPDQEYKKGPDNLWHSANGCYFLIECKDEVDLKRKEISKDEAGQMSNHISWFESEYPDAPSVTNLWIHPTNVLSNLADINKEIFVITPSKLDLLKKQIQKSAAEYQAIELKSVSDEVISRILKQYNFLEKAFVNVYMEKLSRAK